jgi:hypothetical protein
MNVKTFHLFYKSSCELVVTYVCTPFQTIEQMKWLECFDVSAFSLLEWHDVDMVQI